ncbi:hypothetical protein J5N97_004472 [Dioscorea zingiberensis]|uniref:Uncharacterized protein n=1 Tax=Dioscorea zingiberensis TaxID=325984 RepID=A0A9D5HRT4_9LILI|nr:hypothetical protein J5N97_004472 [Dioscorea zingiberensis]
MNLANLPCKILTECFLLCQAESERWFPLQGPSESFIEVISTWGVHNKVDLVSPSYTRHVEDVRVTLPMSLQSSLRCG